MKKTIDYIKKHKIDILVMVGLVGFIVIGILVKDAYSINIKEPRYTVIPSKSLIPYVREIEEPVETKDIGFIRMQQLDVPEDPVEEKIAIIEEVAEIEEPVVEEEKVLYFDVPLDRDLQDHIFKVCEDYGIDPAIVIAIIEKESTYRAYAIGDSGRSIGLMQIQPRWHKDRMKRLGCTSENKASDDVEVRKILEKYNHNNDPEKEALILCLLDPYQNVTVGIDILAGLIDCNEGMEWALMAYNGGSSYAYKKVKAGVVSDYAKTVLANAQSFVRVE